MDALLSTIYLLICITMLGFGYALGKSAASSECSDFGAFSNGTSYYTCAPSAPRYQK